MVCSIISVFSSHNYEFFKSGKLIRFSSCFTAFLPSSTSSSIRPCATGSSSMHRLFDPRSWWCPAPSFRRAPLARPVNSLLSQNHRLLNNEKLAPSTILLFFWIGSLFLPKSTRGPPSHFSTPSVTITEHWAINKALSITYIFHHKLYGLFIHVWLDMHEIR